MTETMSRDTLEMHDLERPRLTSTLNVLTILTFIGCAIQLLMSIWSFITAEETYKNKDKMIEQMNSGDMPDAVRNMVGDPAKFDALITASYENRLPIFLLGIISVALCFWGALQMRKLKKQGYLIYVIGELMPFLTMGIFIGTIGYSGVGFYISAAIAVLFILLYTSQRKHLVY